jgi:hypothetical protein
LDLGSAWLGDLRNQDDITIVVVKKKWNNENILFATIVNNRHLSNRRL